MSIQLSPLNEQQLNALTSLTAGLNREQLLWINGYFQGFLASSGTTQQVVKSQPKSDKQLKILYGTHTGRSKIIAGKLAGKLANRGVEVVSVALDDYKTRQLISETNVVFIVSTHGEGEPPAMAEDFHGFITGKRSPKLPNLNYSVVALGDRSYKFFCKTGIDIDQALEKSGANSILPILTLDVDFDEEVDRWIADFTDVFAEIPTDNTPSNIQNSTENIENYTRKNPFLATVVDKVKITGRDSDKEVYHVELSLEGSGITYEPGDSVGILANNPPQLVDDILNHLGFDGTESVTIKDGVFSLLEALSNHLEITVINRDVIQKYQAKTGNNELHKVIENEELLDRYLYGNDVLDLLEDFPFSFSAQDLADVLRAFPARLYSISSSQAAVGDEVHITVSTVRYSNKGRLRGGACSTYLADRIEIDSQVTVFIEKNPAFKLPENEETPVILIGAGTGVAPYRAFLQQREANNQKGKTWLFFGERRFHSDFLYQVEWQKLLKEGYLEKIDVAFSRDQEEKIYVQTRLIEKQKEVFEWLKNGANIYLCGDMKQMAHDVQNTLLRIFETQGGLTEEKALEYLKTLKKEKRFQTDVY
ncbi:sulfite reductase [NADPH] flavoprotein alpha-component [Aquipluma nitroreducens]|uniref:assimilatory sulfite reductase (NADPH) n=1 Tax=Aquipluma nitroreducens TaxID=2010828 RepID=A0A5K7S2E1_9BACT|nr:assimilatory sulfite reductase (NADPH) flavoprotein subunit [Aquipluma nitroreducens]BBE15883.1 sulfite reductase [NADPH] flavoprotein alpha-component [Aquipluma nitroreducens]